MSNVLWPALMACFWTGTVVSFDLAANSTTLDLRDWLCSAPTPKAWRPHLMWGTYIFLPRCKQDAQHFRDYIMTRHKYDYSWCAGLAWVDFQERKGKKVFMVLKAFVCFAHYAYSTFAITICLLLFHSCRLHHLFHSCLFSSFLEQACHYSVFF